MRISDWSSDVCSSDLADRAPHLRHQPAVLGVRVLVGAGHLLGQPLGVQAPAFAVGGGAGLGTEPGDVLELLRDRDLQDRKSVVYGKSVSVRVDLGGRRIIKKKKTKRQ